MERTEQNNWVFLPVHKSRIIKELDKATLIEVDFDRSTILPKVFRRAKETSDYVFYSLPQDFNANIRVSVRNEQTRKYEHKDYSISVDRLVDSGLDKKLVDEDKEIEVEVGKSVEPVEELVG